MSTIKDACKDCWVESVDENSVCYSGKHRIHFCSLHKTALSMKETLIDLRKIRDNIPMNDAFRANLWDAADTAIFDAEVKNDKSRT